ncbi:MAG: PAS domain S-box protein [Bacillota bacterium]
MSNAKILIVEDEGIAALDLQQTLISMGYPSPDIVASGEEAIEKAGETCPDLVLMDIMLHGEIDGTKAAGQIYDLFGIPVIYLTAYADEDTLQRAKIAEPYGYIVKPFKERELHITIDMALYKHKAERELKDSEKHLRKLNKELELRVRERTAELESLNQALRESEERYRRIVETATEGIWVIDRTCRTTFANKKMAEMLACTAEEMVGNSLYDFIDDEWTAVAEKNMKCCQQGISEQHELKLRRKDGKELWAIISANPFLGLDGQYTGSLAMVTDITKRKQLEKEIVRLDRLHIVGEMAAGIGHEIRNPMTTVRGLLQILGGKEECIKYKSYFDLMIEELDNANSIITEFLSLARNKPTNLKEQNLNLIIETISPLITADAINLNMQAVIKTDGNIPDLLLDEKEIRQLILNLVRNGLEAMNPGGRLTIKTYIDDKETVLSVQDQGKGIEPDIMEKIGTPFFTTKENGTGMGLAVCYGIANRHNALIDIETNYTGTTFYIRFARNKLNNVTIPIWRKG